MTNQKNLKSGIEWRIDDNLVPYDEALAVMGSRVDEILNGTAGELVWLLEHPPLYTAGTSASASELLDPTRFPVVATGRGGKHTYHGPGQRVVYAMMDLTKRDRDLKAHVWRLEEATIRAVASFGIVGGRRKDRIGVWVDVAGQDKKVAAIGVRARRWITSHGLALNVNPDLSHFAGIVPCGIKEFGVTSLYELGVQVTMDAVDDAFAASFSEVFGA
ncbi:MAG: lipoyl(octanoyl) transferase LipB [Alphaproteobacteria bacterium]|nr:lipoyl(octanoyl) transferase LipB [Alphaproteobacteria bacterium]